MTYFSEWVGILSADLAMKGAVSAQSFLERSKFDTGQTKSM